MKKILIGLSVLLVTFFSGCATSYQANGLTGGYKDIQLGEDVFKVSFKGNAYTSRDRASEFALLRAAEVTLEHGYKYFVIIDAQNYAKTSSYTTPKTYNTYGSVSGYGNTAYYRGTTYTTGGQTFTSSRHRSSNIIKCFKTKPSINAIYYDAKLVAKTIKTQYKIK